jgi:hypothetical protein
VGQFVKQSGRNGKSALSVGQCQKDSVIGGMALLGAMQSVEPGVELLAAVCRAELGVVGDVA